MTNLVLRDGKWFTMEDGQECETELEEEFWAMLGFCCCGQPDQLIPLFVNYLRFCGMDSDKKGRAVGWEKGAYRDNLTMLIAYVCDKEELTDHGTGIGWAWLTEKGGEWLALLSQVYGTPT